MLMAGVRGVPFDLTPIGAPCALRTDAVALIPGTGSSGSYAWNASLTATAVNGVAVYLQAAAPDPAANTLGLVFSNGLAAIWPYQNRPAVRIWTRDDDTSTSGHVAADLRVGDQDRHLLVRLAGTKFPYQSDLELRSDEVLGEVVSRAWSSPRQAVASGLRASMSAGSWGSATRLPSGVSPYRCDLGTLVMRPLRLRRRRS